MADEAPSARGRRPGQVARSLAHVLALVAPAIPIGVLVGLDIGDRWRPASDDAAIAWRAWDVFTAHAPLLGAFNDATRVASQPIYDLGPFEYYLLAVPDRIDPVRGILWGAALVCVLLAGLAVEAAWRAGGPIAAAAVSAGAVVFAATQPTAMINLPWNPNLGLYAFAATLVLSAIAGSGRPRWWPVAVVSGSLAAQCHLIFAPASLAALVLGLAFAIGAKLRQPEAAGRVRGPLVAGLALALLSVLPPLIQQLTSRSGNVSLLLHNLGHQGPKAGTNLGLRAIDRVAGFPPAWARPAPPISGPGWYLHFLHALFGGSATAGIVLLVACGAVACGAFASRRLALAALAAVAAGSGLALAWTFGSIESAQISIATYTDVALWPVGMMIDAALAWAAAEMLLAAIDGLAAVRLPKLGSVRRLPSSGGAVLAGTCALLAPLGLWAVTSLAPVTSSGLAVIGGWPVARAIAPLARSIERRGAHDVHQPVFLEPSVPLLPGGLPTWALTEGLAYQLKVAGYDVRVFGLMQPELGADAAAVRGEAAYLIEPTSRSTWAIVTIARPRPIGVLAKVVHDR